MAIGMVPTALGKGMGSEFRAPMAVAVIGGLLTSTFLTLLVIPVGYTLMDDLFSRRRAPAPQPVELTRPAPVTGAGKDLPEDEDRP